MIFTEPVFLAFLAPLFLTYWFVLKGRESRLGLLLAASAIFYGWWDWRFLFLIGLVIGVSWWVAIRASHFPKAHPVRRFWLTAAIVINLTVLAVFKYFGFFTESTAAALGAMGLKASFPVINILLPVGISFYIFQAISYVVDTARGHIPAEKRLRRVALYIAFFPQLVAGPIVRAASFFPQMEKTKRLSGALIASGGRAFLIGFAYKAGIADNLAPFVDPVYGDALAPGDANLEAWSNSALIAATLAFAGQIYFDFAGYSLMAIGVARWFGYYIPKNFDYPYSALSVTEFWRRWHISLSTWLRDYLYIPLGGNRAGQWMTYRNLMVTMVLGGLWHGAAWTFIAWGALHGAALAFHRAVFIAGGRRIGAALALIATQCFILLSWVPFRAEDFGDMVTIWAAFTGLRVAGPETLPWFVWGVPLLIALDAAMGRSGLSRLSRAPVLREPAIWWAGLGALTALLLALYPLEAAPFVYFRF
ncbi:MAG: MBOAT family protein [Alphaproteobacteria bacterium]|jgi:D-alanyl-lipoteichoic acid acyltransferase DltB (MBOAT superfamily)|nr:MBOAT family protein [Alphaproteobacteria bacterium]